MKALAVVLVVVGAIALAALVLVFFGWLITVIAGLFGVGVSLALWQGAVIAFVISALTGGSGRAATR